MPVIVFWRVLLAFLAEFVWPAFVKLLTWTGIPYVFLLLKDWFTVFFAERIVQNVAMTAIAIAGMACWGVFLLVFWTWVTGNGLRELLLTNPFSYAPSGALYLASHFFPLKFFIGSCIAFIQWRLTVVHAALVMVRLIKVIHAF